MSSVPPLPLTALEYQSEKQIEWWRGPVRAVGLIVAVTGIIRSLTEGSSIAASRADWADPFFKRTNYSALPLPALLELTAAVGTVSGAIAAAGGVGCFLGRAWARWVLLAAAILELVWQVSRAAEWASYLNVSYSTELERAFNIGSQTGYSLMSLTAPTIILILVRQPRFWTRRVK